jgi:CBS domain-containing protein
MRARSIMSTTLHTVEPTTPIMDVIRLLLEQEISGVPVVEDGRVVGIVSKGDLILRERAQRPRGGMAYLAQQLFEDHAKLAEEYKKAHGLVAEDVMTRNVVTVLPGTPIEDVAHLLAERNIKRVPVVEDGRLVGIVSRRDVLRATAQRLVGEESAGRPVGQVSDAEIVRRLLDALRGEPWAEVGHLTPTSEDGIVTLRGDAESAIERDAIEIAARGIPGVREVRNELRVRPDIADET